MIANSNAKYTCQSSLDSGRNKTYLSQEKTLHYFVWVIHFARGYLPMKIHKCLLKVCVVSSLSYMY